MANNIYSGFDGNGMSKKDAEQQKKAVENLNAKVGAKNRVVEVKQRPDGKYYVEESFKK